MFNFLKKRFPEKIRTIEILWLVLDIIFIIIVIYVMIMCKLYCDPNVICPKPAIDINWSIYNMTCYK